MGTMRGGLAPYVLAACSAMAAACGGSGNSPTTSPTPLETFLITRPVNGTVLETTSIDVVYSFNDPGRMAHHADFVLDTGAVQKDMTLDGAYQISGISPGQHKLAGYLADAADSKIAGTDSSVAFTITPPASGYTVVGNVKDRINGGNINGSTIVFSGPVSKSAPVDNGAYSLSGLPPGNYNVAITGGSHETHETKLVTINGNGNAPFSVLAWGSGKFGATYDQSFRTYYNLVSRSSFENSIHKWDMSGIRPTQIYVTDEGLSVNSMNEFMMILNEVNSGSVSDMYCGRVQPLAISHGPPTGRPVNEDLTDGMTIIRFDNGNSTLSKFIGNTVTAARVRLDTNQYNGLVNSPPDILRKINKATLIHELFHAAYASHADNTFPDTVMLSHPTATSMSPQDKLASCIVYNDDTHPGNVAPDVNPTYSLANGSINSVGKK